MKSCQPKSSWPASGRTVWPGRSRISSTTESATTWVVSPSGVAGKTVSMLPASRSPGRTSRRSLVIIRTPVPQPVSAMPFGFLIRPPNGTTASAPRASADSPSVFCSRERRAMPVIASPSTIMAAAVRRSSSGERPSCRS